MSGNAIYNNLLGINNKNPASIQTKPFNKNMVVNNTGGMVFAQDNFSRLRRWLILGSEKNGYYVSAKDNTVKNVQCLQDCIKENYKDTVDLIAQVSKDGIAPKNDQCVLALALVTCAGNVEATKYALSKLREVCRIGTHLFQFCETLNNLRGWGKSVRTAVSDWYQQRDLSSLVYQVTKYQNREGWRHRDVLRLAHPKFENKDFNKVANWMVKGEVDFPCKPKKDLLTLWAFEKAKKATNEKEIIELINNYGLVREHIPTNFLNSVAVWEALLENMPMNALVRNLGKMTSIGLLKPLSKATKLVVEKLNDDEYIKNSYLHPVSVLNAITVYKQGKGDKGSLTWSPVSNIRDALNSAFYSAFKYIKPTNKNWLLGIDVSGSMTGACVTGLPLLMARDAAACMAMATYRTEPWVEAFGFCGELVDLNISKNDSLETVCSKVQKSNFGSTNPGALFEHAIKNRLDVDAFVVYTDGEVNHGKHVFQLLDKYQQIVGKPSKFIMCGFTSNGFTLADPSDFNSMDIAGFDSSAPAIMSEFVSGNV